MHRTVKPPLPSRTLEFARQLRSRATDAERILWYHLRAKRFQGWKWRRQHPLPPYILDYYCHAARLVVELDGGQHNDGKDRARLDYLESRGLRVMRFWDNQLLRETEQVLEAIFQALSGPALSPAPLPAGEGNEGVSSHD
jgi:very-short-patch-repair endonuclease